MSFIDDIVGYLGQLTPTETEPLVEAFRRSASVGDLVNRVTSTVGRSNEPQEIKRNKIAVDVDPDYKIPVVYGEAFVGGIITDAQQGTDCGTMFFCITLCESTGTLLSTGEPSSYSLGPTTFPEVYWDDFRIFFRNDRVTVDKLIAKDFSVDTAPSGLVEVYLYGGNSDTPINSETPAYSVMPNWTSDHAMTDLVFAIVKVKYDKAAKVTGLPRLTFKVRNSMNKPGDVLYDYMTNTRYGAGIDPQEINT